jgi:CheY-like chemotaxis protein
MSETDISIVLVEDNSSDAELVMRAFKKHNLANNLVILQDGAEALEYFLGESNKRNGRMALTKVILLDLKLPKVDGTEVLRRLKADERTKNIPVVILTSSSEQRDLKECYELGVNSYVTKPIKFTDFAKVIADVGLYWLVVNKLPAR